MHDMTTSERFPEAPWSSVPTDGSARPESRLRHVVGTLLDLHRRLLLGVRVQGEAVELSIVLMQREGNRAGATEQALGRIRLGPVERFVLVSRIEDGRSRFWTMTLAADQVLIGALRREQTLEIASEGLALEVGLIGFAPHFERTFIAACGPQRRLGGWLPS
jgi:hypothetical protein